MSTPEQPVTPSEVLPRAVPRSAEDLDALAAEIRGADGESPVMRAHLVVEGVRGLVAQTSDPWNLGLRRTATACLLRLHMLFAPHDGDVPFVAVPLEDTLDNRARQLGAIEQRDAERAAEDPSAPRMHAPKPELLPGERLELSAMRLMNALNAGLFQLGLARDGVAGHVASAARQQAMSDIKAGLKKVVADSRPIIVPGEVVPSRAVPVQPGVAGTTGARSTL